MFARVFVLICLNGVFCDYVGPCFMQPRMPTPLVFHIPATLFLLWRWFCSGSCGEGLDAKFRPCGIRRGRGGVRQGCGGWPEQGEAGDDADKCDSELFRAD